MTYKLFDRVITVQEGQKEINRKFSSSQNQMGGRIDVLEKTVEVLKKGHSVLRDEQSALQKKQAVTENISRKKLVVEHPASSRRGSATSTCRMPTYGSTAVRATSATALSN